MESSFNTERVNQFIDDISFSCELLNNVKNAIFTEKINKKLFNKSCSRKLDSLKRNKLFVTMCAIIGYKNKQDPDNIQFIEKEISKTLLYNFTLMTLKTKKRNLNFYIK